ncbi:MAG: FG-GAP repeat domain-containing protein [Adhaeribacter sp.]
MLFCKKVIILFIGVLLVACGGPGQNGINNGFTLSENISAKNLQIGRQLAKQRCQSCHAFPEPDLLDKESWERYVLPTMGYRMGLYHRNALKAIGLRREIMETGLAGELVLQANIFPEEPTISNDDFQKITDYYLTAAPAKPLPPAHKPAILPTLTLFQPYYPELPYQPASTTLVKIDPVNHQVYLGLAQANILLTLNKQGKILKTLTLNQAASNMLLRPEGHYILNMGSFFPSDAPTGSLTFYAENNKESRQILKGLQRPVQAQFADLNQDNREDVLVCEFGNQTGSLSWYENTPAKNYRKHLLKNAPGATRAYVQDLNGDRRPDIIALMAQGNEGIFIFYNEGQGRFREEQVLRFSPAMGSSYFELVDFNHDGYLDILYTAGDNADFAPIPKRYHGIRLYLNNGQNQFLEAYFFHQNGSYKATAADFDNDGDLDIAAIAFYARFQQNPGESFVYLQNEGNLKFKAFTFKGSNRGRWLTLDKGDLDGDGDLDLVLGSFVLKTKLASEAQNQDWATQGSATVILENKSR